MKKLTPREECFFSDLPGSIRQYTYCEDRSTRREEGETEAGNSQRLAEVLVDDPVDGVPGDVLVLCDLLDTDVESSLTNHQRVGLLQDRRNTREKEGRGELRAIAHARARTKAEGSESVKGNRGTYSAGPGPRDVGDTTLGELL